jgi:hypothetical protein
MKVELRPYTWLVADPTSCDIGRVVHDARTLGRGPAASFSEI